MKGKEASKLRVDEIAPELTRLRKEMYDLRAKSVTEKIEDTTRFGHLKRDIARVLTRKRQIEIEAAKK
jgi:large subunit ribosomal protein L29